MTVKQFRRKIDIARKYGYAALDDGATLYYHGFDFHDSTPWVIEDKNHQVVDVASTPQQFDYLYK